MEPRRVGTVAAVISLALLCLCSNPWSSPSEHQLERNGRRLSLMSIWSHPLWKSADPLLQAGSKVKSTDLLRKRILQDFHILLDAQLMNCAIHKDASTTMNEFFAEVIGSGAVWGLPKTTDQTSCFETLGEESCRELVLSGGDEWIKMAVVRDPEERLVSAFLDKCARPDGPLKACILRFFPSVYGNATEVPFTAENKLKLTQAIQADRQTLFEEFASNVISAVRTRKMRCRINHHFAPQTCFCGFEDQRLLAEYELLWIHEITPTTLEQRIIRRLAVPDAKKDRLRQVTLERFAENLSGDHATAATSAHRSMMTPELRAQVRVAFDRDYELLGRAWGEEPRQQQSPEAPRPLQLQQHQQQHQQERKTADAPANAAGR
ncbi:unnamed protein product [Phaeothamnion confervicola]